MKELEKNELEKIEGGLFPVVIFGIVITAKAAAYIVAGAVFAAGVYMGYREAAEADEANTTGELTVGC